MVSLAFSLIRRSSERDQCVFGFCGCVCVCECNLLIRNSLFWFFLSCGNGWLFRRKWREE